MSRDPPIVRCGVSVGRCGWGGACPRPSDHLVAFCSVRPAPRAGWCGAGGCSVQSGRRAQPEGCRGGNGRPGGPSLGARAARVPPGCPPGGWRSRAAGLGPSRGAAAWTELRAGRRPGGAGVWSTGSERGAGRGGPAAGVCLSWAAEGLRAGFEGLKGRPHAACPGRVQGPHTSSCRAPPSALRTDGERLTGQAAARAQALGSLSGPGPAGKGRTGGSGAVTDCGGAALWRGGLDGGATPEASVLRGGRSPGSDRHSEREVSQCGLCAPPRGPRGSELPAERGSEPSAAGSVGPGGSAGFWAEVRPALEDRG